MITDISNQGDVGW